MRDFFTLLTLPASLLHFVAVQAQEQSWPYNLPRTVRYHPEHEYYIKRELEAQERLAWQAPAQVKKMNKDDVGEKFYLHDWGFGDQSAQWRGVGIEGSHSHEKQRQDERYPNNLSIPELHSAIAPHSDEHESSLWLRRRNLFKRSFQCPAGTKSCASIGQSDLCCDVDETCVNTSDGVGCCPNGASCGTNIGDCDTNAGYHKCPNSPNGGCCVPGAQCAGVGCVFRGTKTVTITLAATTLSSGATEVTGGRTVTIVYPTTEISVTTKTVTLKQSTNVPAASSSSQLTCKTGFFSCPGSYSGGCCPNGQACGPDDTCPDITTSVSARPPVRGTSVSTTPTSVSTTSVVGCPTGFYMCSARYLGGCCRVGRDCHTTSCPPQDTKTLISSGVTVVVTSSDSAATGGTCANGWFLCGANEDGGCCPSGYECGRVSCTATNQGQENTLKMAPNGGNMLRWAWSFLAFALIAGAGMMWL